MPRGYFRLLYMMRRGKSRKSSHPYQRTKEACNHKQTVNGIGSTQADMKKRSSDKDTENYPILKLEHKIFISHSGRQKTLAESVCEGLEARYHNPFFDRREDSLPIAASFPALIVRAAEQCEMLIVVVSDDYFMSKWAMIELNAFVRAQKLGRQPNSIEKEPVILPLFYRLLPSDLGKESNQEKWFDRWEALAKNDPKERIVVNDWKYAFDILRSSKGVVYAKASNNVSAYVRDIVSAVCRSIVPDTKWDDSHVHGKSSISKVIREKIDGVANSTEYHVKVVGIYGVGGIGKTTTCHTLCNELSDYYDGRVCHIEFQSEASTDSTEVLRKHNRDLLEKVLIELCGKSRKTTERWDEGMCKNELKTLLSKQSVFLAIDNVSYDSDLMEQVQVYLKGPHHKDSCVMVTSRSKFILERFRIDGDACLEMPELGKVDAENLFLQHAVGDEQDFGGDEWEIISMCVEKCNFLKGAGERRHFHPLALKVLGLLVGRYGKNPRNWVKHLVMDQGFSESSKKNRVFDILRSSFDALTGKLRTLFMDVGFFDPGTRIYGFSTLEWLCDIHKQGKGYIQIQLEELKTRGLLQDVDKESGRVSMHDLYREFGELELRGKLNNFQKSGKRRWMYVEDDDLTKVERIPEGGLWGELTRLGIVAGSFKDEDSEFVDGMGFGIDWKAIKWEHFRNVQVLELSNLDWKGEVLNLKPMKGLRSLNVYSVRNVKSIEGLEELLFLTHIHWVVDDEEEMGFDSPNVGQLPPSLKVLKIDGSNGQLGSDLLSRCEKLSKLELSRLRTDVLNLKNCPCLVSVDLKAILICECLLLPSAGLLRLEYLRLSDCDDLVYISGIERLTNLRILRVPGCPKLKVHSLLALTQLRELELCGEPCLQRAKDCIPGQLEELVYSGGDTSEKVNLDGFTQLKVLNLSFNGLTSLEAVRGLTALHQLDLRFNTGLTSFEAVGGLPALRSVRIEGCQNLLRVPDLSKSRDLECLRVSGCRDLVHISGINRLTKLRELRVLGWPKLKVSSLLALTQLQELEFRGAGSLEHSKDFIPGQVRELRYYGKRAVEKVNLEGFTQLEILDFFGTPGLTFLDGVGHLHALRNLDLTSCRNLLRLPDLSKSRSLHRLGLSLCECLELHERDIEMLSGLPMLGPVVVIFGVKLLTLDFVRRKVRIRRGSDGEEEVRDLGAPPIKFEHFVEDFKAE